MPAYWTEAQVDQAQKMAQFTFIYLLTLWQMWQQAKHSYDIDRNNINKSSTKNMCSYVNYYLDLVIFSDIEVYIY